MPASGGDPVMVTATQGGGGNRVSGRQENLRAAVRRAGRVLLTFTTRLARFEDQGRRPIESMYRAPDQGYVREEVAAQYAWNSEVIF